MKNERKFNFYKSYYDIANQLKTQKEQAEFFMSVCKFKLTGQIPKMSDSVHVAFYSQKELLGLKGELFKLIESEYKKDPNFNRTVFAKEHNVSRRAVLNNIQKLTA
jgi:hypothetical protein